MSEHDRVIVVDIMKDIVASPSTKISPSLIAMEGRGFDGLHFKYGKRLAIISELTQDTNASLVKYPLICLLLPIDENMNAPGYYARATMGMAIVVDTDVNHKTADRYDINFRPILYPIYEGLKKEIEIFTYGLYKPIAAPPFDGFPHIKRDNPYWERGNNENAQIDPLDAIELENLELMFNTKNC